MTVLTVEKLKVEGLN